MNRLILVATLALGAAILASTSFAGRSSSHALRLVGTATTQKVTLDVPPKGDSPGDMGVKVGTIAQDGKRVGRYQGVCFLLPAHGSLCTFTLSLPGGQILLQSGYGPGLNDGAVVREPIVGGSGVYAGIR